MSKKTDLIGGEVDAFADFPSRLQLAVGDSSVRAFALQCGLSPTGMHQYLVGKSEPTRPVLIKIAQLAGVNLEWLMTGMGAMKKHEHAIMVDRDIYDIILFTVDEYFDKKNKKLPKQKKQAVCHALYKLFGEEQKEKLIEKVIDAMPIAESA